MSGHWELIPLGIAAVGCLLLIALMILSIRRLNRR